MKFKVCSVLVIFLFVSLMIVANPCNAGEKKQKEVDFYEALLDKINETKEMLDFHFNKKKDANQLRGYLTQLIRAKGDDEDIFKLTKEDGTITEVESEILDYLEARIDKGLTFEVMLSPPEEVSGDPENDFKSLVNIKYEYPTPNPGTENGEMDFYLFHMRICIWW